MRSAPSPRSNGSSWRSRRASWRRPEPSGVPGRQRALWNRCARPAGRAASCDPVLVHDAARPLLTPSLVRDVLAALGGVDAAIAAAPVTDTVKQAGADRLVTRDARPLAAVGGADAAGVHAGGADARARRRPAVLAPARPTTPRSSSVSAALCASCPRRSENLKVTTPLDLRLAELLLAQRAVATGCGPGRPACLNRRPDADRLPRPSAADDPEATADGSFTARQRRALPRGGRASAGSPSSASPSTSTASATRSACGSIRGGRSTRSTTSTRTARSCARTPTCGSVSRPISSPAARTAWRTCSTGAVGLRRRLGALPRRLRASTRDEYERLGQRVRGPEEVWRRYFQTLGEAARSGLYDILAHPDLVKVWGRERPRPEGDLRRYYELAWRASPSPASPSRSRPPGCASAPGEIYPARAFLEMAVDAGVPIALSSDAHGPEHIGYGYDEALRAARRRRRGELCVFEGRARRLEPIGAT